jgi:predicted amidohydrolase
MAEVIRGDFGHAGDFGSEGTASVACLNLSPGVGDVQDNLSLAERELRAAASAHRDLRWVVLPELFTSAYSSLEDVRQYAEDAIEGASARHFTALARELGIYIAYGFPEISSGSPYLYDSASLVGPEGVLLTYRKRHLVHTTMEPEVFTPGNDLPVVEAGGLRVAVAICWDLGFPEVAREAAMMGAELVLAPSGWRDPWGPQYDLSCAARALDNGIYVASANQLGGYVEARFTAPGHAYGPDGLRVSHDDGAFGTRCVGEIDPHSPARWRRLYGDTTMGYPGPRMLPLLIDEPAV